MTVDELRPWQRIPTDLRCAICGDQATKLVYSSAPMIKYGALTTHITVGVGEPHDQEFSCENHMLAILHTKPDGCGAPIRMPWRNYLLWEVPGLRWLGRIEVWLQNDSGRRVYYLVYGKGWQRLTAKAR